MSSHSQRNQKHKQARSPFVFPARNRFVADKTENKLRRPMQTFNTYKNRMRKHIPK